MQRTLERIKQQQKDMGYYDSCKCSPEFQIDYMRNISLALIKEVSEFLDEVPWKPWRDTDEQKFNTEKAAKELCDIIVFTFVLYLTLEPSVSLEDAMEQTMTKIENRIKQEGYGQKE